MTGAARWLVLSRLITVSLKKNQKCFVVLAGRKKQKKKGATAVKPTRVWVLERRGRGALIPAIWIRTVERGKKKGWYVLEFPTGPYSKSLGLEGGVFEGRRRKRPVAVPPDQIKKIEEEIE